jgi:hypothetical protein
MASASAAGMPPSGIALTAAPSAVGTLNLMRLELQFLSPEVAGGLHLEDLTVDQEVGLADCEGKQAGNRKTVWQQA